MDDHRIHTIVPRLRFPDFLNDGEWEVKLLGEIADYENGIAHENDIDSDGDFIIVNSKFISSDGQIKKRTNVPRCLAQKDDVLMVLSDLPNGRALAKCFYVAENNLYTVNQRICKFHPKNVHSKLLYYLVNRNEYFLSFDDGVKQTNLKKGDVLNCPLIIPKSIEEQDFIAICLTSLDEMLSATNGKLEQLKAYKKGLMQKLFPARGKKLPELRFKEFEKDGEWEEKELGVAAKVKSGYAFRSNTYTQTGRYKIITISNVKNGYLDLTSNNFVEHLPEDIQPHQILKKGDILISMTGNVGRVCKVCCDNCLLNQRVGLVDVYSSDVDRNYIYTILTSDWFEKSMIESGQGAAQANIGNKDIEGYRFFCPPTLSEQCKIADSVTSIDEMINQYVNKVTLLELYKKGLMQQLFPTSK